MKQSKLERSAYTKCWCKNGKIRHTGKYDFQLVSPEKNPLLQSQTQRYLRVFLYFSSYNNIF